jgi:hypothetical protein
MLPDWALFLGPWTATLGTHETPICPYLACLESWAGRGK